MFSGLATLMPLFLVVHKTAVYPIHFFTRDISSPPNSSSRGMVCQGVASGAKYKKRVALRRWLFKVPGSWGKRTFCPFSVWLMQSPGKDLIKKGPRLGRRLPRQPTYPDAAPSFWPYPAKPLRKSCLPLCSIHLYCLSRHSSSCRCLTSLRVSGVRPLGSRENTKE